MATWRKLLGLCLKENKETFDDIIKITLTKEQLDKRFDDGFGFLEGEPFNAWTKDHVYFADEYDCNGWISSVLRNPCEKAIEYIGGGD